MEQTKWNTVLKFLTQALIVLVYITKGVCWLLKTVNSYFVEWLDSALVRLKKEKA